MGGLKPPHLAPQPLPLRGPCNALMNQRRFIEKQNKLTGIELDNIKKRVENELNVQNNQTDSVVDDVSVEEANNLYEEPNEEEVEPSQNPPEIKDLVNEIKRARAEWENIRMAERPPLPKISMNRKTELLIKQANQAIQLVIAEEVPNLNNINLLQYVTAYVISEKLGKATKIPKTKSNKRQQPKWKTRIENQIKNMRADLSILTDMAFLMWKCGQRYGDLVKNQFEFHIRYLVQSQRF